MVNISDREIVKHARVNLPVSDAWRLWTTQEGLNSFIGVDNRIELIPGGPFEIYFLMDNPVGERGGEGNKVLSFLPQKMLSFSWNAPPTIPEIRKQHHRTWLVLEFSAVDANSSELTLHHLGWLEGDKWDETFNYFERAWELVMDSLKERCGTMNTVK